MTRPNGLKDGEVCPRCGTPDCIDSNPNVFISGPGIIKTLSEDVLKTCNARRQIKILKHMRIIK